MKRRNFVVPYSAADEGTADAGIANVDDLDAALDAAAAGETSQAAQEGAQTSEPDASNGESQTQPDGTKHTQEQKQEYAWNEMRKSNKELLTLLGKVADANGIKYQNDKDLVKALNDDAIVKMSQKTNVPVEILQELEQLKADSQAWKAQQLRETAAIGFENLKQQFGLEQADLEAFAVELDQKGLNPFLQPVDLVKEYQTAHFDEIVQKRIDAAVQAALQKSSAADAQSATVSTNAGSNGNSKGEAISTVAGLSAIMAGWEA